jgi:hypothetical protein
VFVGRAVLVGTGSTVGTEVAEGTSTAEGSEVFSTFTNFGAEQAETVIIRLIKTNNILFIKLLRN